MRVRLLGKGAGDLGDPASTVWSQSETERIALVATPLGLQPSDYVKASRADRPFGRVSAVDVRAVHDGAQVAFLLSWDDPDRDDEPPGDERFPDGAALLFPLVEGAPLVTMGAEGKPVNAWHWRADRPGHARNNVAVGLGTTRVTAEPPIAASAVWGHGGWRVVLRRALQTKAPAGEAVALRPGQTISVAYAVWEGSSGERGGIKSFSPTWHSLTLED